ncbi:MAG: SIMPL domain-containing protein [Balneolaceae bacterium]
MQRNITLFSTLILILLSGLPSVYAQPIQISVEATGEISLPADLVSLQIQITVDDSTPEAVFQRHKELEEKLASLIRDQQIDSSQLYFQPMNISSGWNRENERIYTSRQQVRLTLEDISRYEGIQVYLIENGFDNFSGQFGTSGEKNGESDALRNAMERARQKADVIASSIGKSVDRIVTVEHGTPPDIWRPNMETAMFRADSSSLMEFPQEVVIRTTVKVVYLLE